MHRSGTSMVAELLHRAGIDMGKLRDPNFEAMHFLSLNQQMLDNVGADWLNPKVLSDDMEVGYTPMELFCEHKKIQSRRFHLIRWLHSSAKWGWKDPRNTFTLAIWLKMWPKARVLHVFRNGWEVAHSLKIRNSIAGEVHDARLDDLEFNFKLWELYVEQAFSYGNAVHLNYNKLLERDLDSIKQLERIAGVGVHSILQNMIREPKANKKQLAEMPDYVLNSKWMQQLFFE